MDTNWDSKKDVQQYVTILSRIGSLLERNGFPFQKGLVDRIVLNLNLESLSLTLNSNDIWGGSGSVTDCDFVSDDGPQSRLDAKSDHTEFCSLLVKLAEQMAVDGIANDRVKSVGGTYARWVKAAERDSK